MLSVTDTITYIKQKVIKAVFDLFTLFFEPSLTALLESSIQSRLTFREAATVNIPNTERDVGPKKVIRKYWLPMLNERQTFVTERDKHPQKAIIIEINVVVDALKYCFEALILVTIACTAWNKRKLVKTSTKAQHVVTALLLLRHRSP